MIECVPNFSEGRDSEKIRAIVAAIEGTSGVTMLGWEADGDHNRSVVTFAGEVETVIEGAIRGAGRAAELIDLNEHLGVHPRVGAADVIPFVPLEGNTLADCVVAAHRAGEELWTRFGIPVYFYESAAWVAERRRLEKTRRAGFDGRPADIGTLAAHATAGASMVGARGFLIAYNVDLETRDAAVAQEIAQSIRESSGGFKHVKAMGLFLPSRGCAQVSMNLVRFEETDLMGVWEAIESEALRLGTRAGDGELIGFVPRAAYERAPQFFERDPRFDSARIIENRIAGLKPTP